jgi:signal transduction histidine kinase
MERQDLEPGLLSIFRIYVVLRFVAMLAVAEFFFLRYGPLLAPLEVPYIVLFGWNIFFLLVYLYWPWPQHKLGRIYLPVALAVASIGPILEGRYLFLVYDAAYEARFWLVFPFLVIPLILTAWQYSFRYVVGLCFATALLEAFLIRTLPALDQEQAMSDMGYLVVRTVFFILIGYIVSHLMTEQREQRRELAQANRKLVRYAATLEQLAVSQERNRLARELHDTLAHTLSGLAVHLDAIVALWTDIPSRARDMLQQALTITREGLDETRRAVQDLRATPLEQEGLALAVRSLAENAAERGGLSLRLSINEHSGPLDPEVEQCYYRVAQEAIENVVKHADASTLSVSLKQHQGRLVLEVTDDGRGLVREGIAREDLARDDRGEARADETQFGVRGMRERAELIGGTLDIKSQPRHGTTIRLVSERIPTPAPPEWAGFDARTPPIPAPPEWAGPDARTHSDARGET